MNNASENLKSSSGRFIQTLQPLRDPESNWTVDLAKNLEEYLLKICSGEISGTDDALISVNFAEAALLLQGSVQVYSRKVEYLYSLVLHALEFISQKSQEDQRTSTSAQPESSDGKKSQAKEDDDPFWVSDDIAVEAKNLLDDVTCKDTLPCHFSRPPANLVVLEGECIDACSDAGELESYLVATNDLYRDFILLDSCDTEAVDEFLNCEGPANFGRGSSVASKSRKSVQSPARRSANKSSVGKKQDPNLNRSPFKANDCNMDSPPNAYDFPEGDNGGFAMGDEYSEPDDSDNEDDPWKPLNPHDLGNLPIKPYKRVKSTKKVGVGLKKNLFLTNEFPLAKLDGPISNELREIWEARVGATGSHNDSQPIPLYEKLRQSFFMREGPTNDAFCNGTDNTEDNVYDIGEDSDIGLRDADMADDHLNDNDIPLYQETVNDTVINDAFEDQDAHASLEDLCRSHLDSLLATFAETEKQTELATRVSTWKQRIEWNLEAQDSRPPFDIHKYGERVLDKLYVQGHGGNPLNFGDVVKGQEKHDVARTFSALLQLVNNGDVELVKSSVNSTSTCYTDVNPFHVRLLKNERKKGILLQSSRKRPKSPIPKKNANSKSNKGKENSPVVYSSPRSCRFSSTNKASVTELTPEGKKRRKSRFIEPMDLRFAG